MEQEVARLQVQLHQANGALEEQKKAFEKLQAEFRTVVDANRRGDQEYRKLQAIISKSKEMQHVSSILEEKEMFAQQAKAVQEILRQQTEELERYKKLVATTGSEASVGSPAASGDGPAESLQSLREQQAKAEDAVANVKARIITATTASAEGEDGVSEPLPVPEDLATQLSEVETALDAIKTKVKEREEEAEAASSAAIRASRLREKMEREAREKEGAMVQALADKETQVVQLMQKVETLEANHARDLQNMYLKLKEKDTEVDAMKKRLEDASRTVAQSESVQRLTEAAKVATAAIEALEAANKELEDRARAKDKKVEFLTNARAEAERHLREVTAALDETASALATVEKSEGELKARTGQLETQVATLTEELDILRPMRSGYETLERRSAHYEAAWNDSKADVRALEARLATLQSTIDEFDVKLEDQKAEHQIATRMLKQMNKELKAQLAKEQKQRSEMKSVGGGGGSSSPRSGVGPPTPGSITPMMSPLTMPSTAPDGHDMGMGSRRDSGASGSATDADETVLMLAKRIQALLSENEAVRERIRFLEAIVNDVNKEKENLKAMIKQLTSSRTVVDGTSSTAQSIVERATRSENPIRVLQTLLLKALTENERLKADMRVLGTELQAVAQTGDGPA